MTKLQTQLAQKFSNYSFSFDLPMAQKTYFKIGGPAEAYVELSNKEKISELVRWCKQENIKLTLFGGGSNIIVDDNGIEGVVIRVIYDEIKHDC